MFLSRVTYSGRVHFRLPTVALALTSLRSVRGAPGLLQKAADLDAMTGHVGKDAAALPLRLPEPRHVRPAMLLGGARQIRAAADRDGAAPHDVLAALDCARKHLVLEIAVHQLGVFGEAQHFPRLGKSATERLFARDADKLRPS